MPRVRIDDLLAIPKKEKVSNKELATAMAIVESSSAHIDEEIAREALAMEVGMEFVKNGSRDRYGDLRKIKEVATRKRNSSKFLFRGRAVGKFLGVRGKRRSVQLRS